MKNYKIDTHVHTSETSRCGKINASNMINLYKQEGYNGVIITDHYYRGFFEALEDMPWCKKVDKYLNGYERAKKEGDKLGIEVYLGMEITFDLDLNDYLVFGLEANFLYNHKNLYKLGIINFKELIKNRNMLIYQAHPFRKKCQPANPSLLDGIEIFNGNLRHDSNNYLALNFAQKYNLKMISGSDFHRKEDLARGGIVLSDIPKKNSSLVKILKNDRIVELIVNDY